MEFYWVLLTLIKHILWYIRISKEFMQFEIILKTDLRSKNRPSLKNQAKISEKYCP